MKEYLQNKIGLVRALLDSDIKIGYEDCALILCTVLSACASCRWPGSRIDRKRFNELLIRLSPSEAHTTWVSVAALINGKFVSEGDTLYGPNGTRIFCDEEIDLSIQDAAQAFPNVGPLNLKRCTYANLIYESLRCGYVHEYGPGQYITQVAASRRPARVSYIGRGHGNGMVRMTAFHLDYLIELAEHHASEAAEQPLAPPATWWMDSETI